LFSEQLNCFFASLLKIMIWRYIYHKSLIEIGVQRQPLESWNATFVVGALSNEAARKRAKKT
jgi:hypothetical protein